ncbi:hypothetical protein ASPZODRAFT_137444 [Penicilliopsis zonata CBS 506.65]|uniref:Uncharacterized protein n=1 Tax=Penicilliopsis zonata CBS 506.65 TaxID=1073090 RepID=A0A1L9S4T2_9EURO|nr:hypothetical protein ASPZODRAFT_137444 [Penicilliopsis zonata CBS 506.65]OJJ42170.1 hypothetical protein ASPZODRAFT_137444 [Penicilliopsis zonata CBS 506.65]
MISKALLTAVLVCGAVAAVLPRDTTITVPDEVVYHAESEEICIPTKWIDVVIFFFGNYFAHAATVVKFPGEPHHIIALNMLLVVLFPCLGAGRGLFVLSRRAALFSKDPLQQALQAQALCMVVRAPTWTPRAGQSLRSLSLRPTTVPGTAEKDADEYWRIAHSEDLPGEYKKFASYSGPFQILTRTPPWLLMNFEWSTKHIQVLKDYQISGVCELPDGYELAYVPANARVARATMTPEQLRCLLGPSYDLAAAVIAIVQIFYACYTLYRSRGFQITTYGYAAFGFTVLPYLLMSLVNLLGTLATPSYAKLSLVQTEIMDEAIARGGRFTDVVGTLASEPLRVEDLIVFTASFQPHGGEVWCQLGDRVCESGSIEPLDGTGFLSEPVKMDNREPETPPSAPLLNDKEQERPTLICPSCYSFQTVSKAASSTSIRHRNNHFGPRSALFAAAVWVTAALPLIPIGVLSRFHSGEHSTLAQRAWILAWYIVGIISVSNPFFSDWIVEKGMRAAIERLTAFKKNRSSRGLVLRVYLLAGLSVSVVGFFLIFGTPAIGRLVVVAQMLMAYGNCTSLKG